MATPACPNCTSKDTLHTYEQYGSQTYLCLACHHKWTIDLDGRAEVPPAPASKKKRPGL